MAAEKWFYIDVGKRRGPVTAKKLRELYLNGDILEQTLVWRRGFDTWPTFIKAFPDIEQPANKKEQAAKEKRRARIELAPKNVTCGVCKRPWPVQYTLATRNGWVCLACKDRLDHEVIKTFDPQKLPKGGPPWPLIIILIGLVGFFLAQRELEKESLKRKKAEAERQARLARTKAPEDSLMLWGGRGRSKLEEPWMKNPPEAWPQLVATHNARIGKNYTIFGGNCVLVDSDSTLIVLASMSQIHPHVVHYLRSLLAVPAAFFENWFIEGIPGKSVRLSARAASAAALADRDIIPFEVDGVVQGLPMPSVPLQIRVNPLAEGERVWVIYFKRFPATISTPRDALAGDINASVPPNTPAQQSAITGAINYILNQGLRFEATIASALPLRTLAGAPVLDERGLLVGIITAPSGSDLDTPAKWVSGDTAQSLIALLEGTPNEAVAPATR